MRLLRTIGGVDFTRQERATLNKLTVSHYEANSLVERSAGLDGVDDRDAHLSAARNHIAIGDWNIHLGDEPCGLGEHLVNPLPPMEEETKK